MKLYIEKHIVIKSDRESVHRLVADYTKWDRWSPWYILDTNTEQTFSGEARQVGHSMTWKSDITGEGTNTITKISEDRIDCDLQFLKPWKSQAKTSFTFDKINEHETKVTWTLDSSLPFFLFFIKKMMVSMIEQDYERGLLMLQEVSETGELKTQSIDKGISEYAAVEYIGIKNTASFAGMPKSMKADFQTIVDLLETKDKKATQWISIYTKHSFAKGEMGYIAAISSENFSETPEGFVRGTIPETKAFTVFHKGDYKYLGNSWNKAMMTAKARKMKIKKYPMEKYLNSPLEIAPDDLLTEIILPIK